MPALSGWEYNICTYREGTRGERASSNPPPHSENAYPLVLAHGVGCNSMINK